MPLDEIIVPIISSPAVVRHRRRRAGQNGRARKFCFWHAAHGRLFRRQEAVSYRFSVLGSDRQAPRGCVLSALSYANESSALTQMRPLLI